MSCGTASPRLLIVKQIYPSNDSPHVGKTAAFSPGQQRPVAAGKDQPSNSSPSQTRVPLIRALSPPKHRAPSLPKNSRKTPVKGFSSLAKKHKSVNLSPVLYSPRLKNSAQLSRLVNDATVKTETIEDDTMTSRTEILCCSPVASCSLMGDQDKESVPNSSPSEQVLCDVQVRSEDYLFVSHSVNGKVYRGLLVSESVNRSNKSTDGSYVAEQLPSQFHKKLKSQLGLSLAGSCDSENSDSEVAKPHPKKLKYSDYKAMRDSIAKSSSLISPEKQLPVTIIPTLRQNIPVSNPSNHNKHTINGIADFLVEAAKSTNTTSPNSTTITPPCSDASSKQREVLQKTKSDNDKTKKLKSPSKSKNDNNSKQKAPLKNPIDIVSRKHSTQSTSKSSGEKIVVKNLKFGEKFLPISKNSARIVEKSAVKSQVSSEKATEGGKIAKKCEKDRKIEELEKKSSPKKQKPSTASTSRNGDPLQLQRESSQTESSKDGKIPIDTQEVEEKLIQKATSSVRNIENSAILSQVVFEEMPEGSKNVENKNNHIIEVPDRKVPKSSSEKALSPEEIFLVENQLVAEAKYSVKSDEQLTEGSDVVEECKNNDIIRGPGKKSSSPKKQMPYKKLQNEFLVKGLGQREKISVENPKSDKKLIAKTADSIGNIEKSVIPSQVSNEEKEGVSKVVEECNNDEVIEMTPIQSIAPGKSMRTSMPKSKTHRPSKRIKKDSTEKGFSYDDFGREYKMRSRSISTSERGSMSDSLRANSSRLRFVDLEWPVWCPRQLELAIKPMKMGRPARLKLQRCGSKRKRTESSELELEELKEDRFTEHNNPFGIGDVVVAKRVFSPGRPHWPARILSVTGLTVCAQFYNTSEVMQISKCNVEWYYEACSYRRISYDSAKDSLEWKEAIEKAEKDVKSCIGEESIVWAQYQSEWWPARVTQILGNEYTVQWLDDEESYDELDLPEISPFLLSHCIRYDPGLAVRDDLYQSAVDRGRTLALRQLLQ